ncbi:MAG TPA: hypothetical protein VFZ09_47600 [Archangium sp.]|uniref:hypothetical protein n=1 Tax=Archangium sp. TaxID=1872627 RepID=UPI002E345CCE|nr:hypothetical protein [Archangium sp.]HEX5753942.1 hypothetical protein [Archangium sp.]
MRYHLLLSFIAMLFASGCSHAPVVYPPAPPIYYAVSFERVRTTEGGALPRQSDVLAQDAAQQLRLGQKVAFLPPDSCTTESVSPSGASQNNTSILMRCGALLASLEAEVAKAGYPVVSWQALKGSGAAGSQERARALGVNILFEVNQLSQESRDPGARQISNLRFSREEGPGRALPVPVMPEVAERCARQLSSLPRSGEREYLSTINLKAVEVATGRALWLYQNTVVELVERNEEDQSKLYYRADGVRPPPPTAEEGMLGTIGRILAAGGAVGVGVGALLAVMEEEEAVAEPSSTPGDLMLAGGVGLGAGLSLMGLDYLMNTPDRTVPAAVYPAEHQVLCASEPQFNPWSTPAPSTAQAPTAQYSYTFTQTAAADRDLSRERAERLTRKSTEDFARALLAVTGR